MRRASRAVPYARSGIWTRRFAVLGAVLAVLAVVCPRRGSVSLAEMLLGVGLGCAALSFVTAAVAAVVIWRTGRKGAGRVLAGLALSGLTLAYPAYVTARTIRDNPASDVSTDRDDPPQFAPATTVAAPGSALDLHWLLGRDKAAADVEPVTFDKDPATAYRAVLKTVTQLHWRVVSATAPNTRSPVGHVDAVTYSTVMRLPEWIAIRIRPQDGQSRIDLRAAAPGLLPLAGDDPLRNIQAFADALEDQDGES